ncbi:MAG: penicillin-binding protein 2 [Rhodospirillales bacterium]|nr:penicillin-binding protein 2 [Rhodospirillales bacterium]
MSAEEKQKTKNKKGERLIARQIEGSRKQAIETGRNRLLVTGAVLTMAFVAIGVRLVDLTVFKAGEEPRLAKAGPALLSAAGRADIVDRNGVILATSLPTASLYADPGAVLNAEDAADRLAKVLPVLNRDEVLAKLNSKGRFVWIYRNLTPEQQYQVNRLGLPGIGFQRGERRVYPHGRLVAHALGLTDVDGRGIAGIEQYFDQSLRSGNRIGLSLDLRIQAVLRDELAAAVGEFRAIGAAGLVLDVHSGEIMAMVSLPDFDPNDPGTANGEPAFNRVTKGVYEMGSTFKLFTAAMALDSGTVTLKSGYDASQPIKISRFTIRDFHAKNRWLSVPEIIVYSSNIGAAKMAIDVGTKTQKAYLGRLGLLQSAALELPEIGSPLTPARWRDINTMTIAYGHGIAVSPIQLASGISALVNGGRFVKPTLLARPASDQVQGKRVLSEETSEQMRGLMRLVVSTGTGRKAAAEGYAVGGKTGTADKLVGRAYGKNATISSFVGAFPIDDPRFVVLVLVDEPKGNKRTFNYATGGWVAAPAVSRVVQRMATLIGMAPKRNHGIPPAKEKVREARMIPAAQKPPSIPASIPEETKVQTVSAMAETRLLKRVRAVLDGSPKTSGAAASGPPEQALATY